MASVSMAASFIGGAAASRGKFVISSSVKVRCEKKAEVESRNSRREVVFAAITTAICSVAGMAMADGPKRGTPEARKAYGPVCVANPTAKICNN